VLASELITALQAILEEHGDLEVAMVSDSGRESDPGGVRAQLIYEPHWTKTGPRTTAGLKAVIS